MKYRTRRLVTETDKVLMWDRPIEVAVIGGLLQQVQLNGHIKIGALGAPIL
jgi:hypothetical protein